MTTFIGDFDVLIDNDSQLDFCEKQRMLIYQGLLNTTSIHRCQNKVNCDFSCFN